ncbi:MAG: type II toxin-antitoxin system Phd/YefM family antitoxin [Burkholderiaceae bacterium]|jgi:prevent-host-death family protein|nr:type II toxin-antitoxin system Phd/YefM family antitoxin [Burkholderiaceae bacterium]
MPIHTVGLEEGRNTLPQLVARAQGGEPSLLTRHGKPVAAIVPPELLDKARPRINFLALRGSGKGLWGKLPARTVAALRDEWV